MFDVTLLKESLDAIIAVTMFAGYALNEIKKYLDQRRKNRKDNVATMFKTLERVYEKLIECRVETSANSVMVLEFHNGDHFMSDSPILKMTSTYETNDASVTKISPEIHNKLITKTQVFVQDLVKKEYITYIDIDNLQESDDFIEILKMKEAKEFYALPLKNNKKDIIGVICLVYYSGKPSKSVQDLLKYYADHVSILLRN